MTDREKVIKELECCISLNPDGPKCANCDYADEFHNGDCETYLLHDAIALLKAQEPVKPVRKQGLYLCGNCHETAVGYVTDFTRKLIKLDNYCRKCGRAVKWND